MSNIKNFKKYFKVSEDLSNESKFNIEEAINIIKNQFSQEYVISELDEEIAGGNWIDSDWEDDGYESEYEWYVDHNNGEAEDVVIDNIIKWYNKNISNLDIDSQIELSFEIKNEYNLN